MTALTSPPERLLSIADYAALSKDDRNRWELQEGSSAVVYGRRVVPLEMPIVSFAR